ncbi:putative zinc-binding metallopeptidase [Mariniflexile sp. AS56]|uniref:zinc-binding metallopeptidase family protein n=1 Tax=Mariniflexile sp. AS56 TaxID=3063957 RepID=UPI0026EAA383|nr:putative zinc-binding metallopeptidase [Mariniflexile sp. AS56]MDO7171200.1 putative zinc-binding metallopeptidase [Mariniflexile sp. AS56]
MKIFECPNCKSPVFFENTICQYCNTAIGYNPFLDTFEIPNNNQDQGSKFCSNYEWGVCNWFVDNNQNSDLCVACSLNRVVPDRSNEDHFEKWIKLETAKHRLIYQLLKLKLPIKSKMTHPDGIAFDFLSENNSEDVRTGHADGVVTIILSEADSVHREQLRKQMNEVYRTLLGHFRHEIGHYYWEVLFDDSNIESYRELFGDERLDYGDALEIHYKNGAPNNWNQNYISAYASSHAWEDWAETWAHYLHLMDTLETANSFGVSFYPEKEYVKQLLIDRCPNPYLTENFKDIFDASVALTCTANSLNRSMGLPDIYPFVVPIKVIQKLTFIHDLLHNKNL